MNVVLFEVCEEFLVVIDLFEVNISWSFVNFLMVEVCGFLLVIMMYFFDCVFFVVLRKIFFILIGVMLFLNFLFVMVFSVFLCDFRVKRFCFLWFMLNCVVIVFVVNFIF